MQRWPNSRGRARLIASLAAAAMTTVIPLVAFAAFGDVTPVEPKPQVVRPMVLVIDLVALIPFTGFYVLAYLIAVLRKRRLPGLTLLALTHIVVGLVIATTEIEALGYVQAALGVVGLIVDRLMARAVQHRATQVAASQSSISVPKMTPVMPSSANLRSSWVPPTDADSSGGSDTK